MSYGKKLKKDSLPFSSGSDQNSTLMFFMSSLVCQTCRFRSGEKGCGRFNLVSVFPLNYYHFNYPLQLLLLVSCCLVLRWSCSPPCSSTVPRAGDAGQGSSSRDGWGSCPAARASPGQGKLPCAAGGCQSCTAVHKSQEDARKEL